MAKHALPDDAPVTCKACGQTKMAADFHACRGARNGKQPKCKTCIRAYAVANRAQKAAWARKQYRADPSYRREINKKWIDNNLERVKAGRRLYVQQNREKCYELGARQRAKKRQAIPPWYDKRAVQEIYREAARISAATGIPHDVDHVIPLTSKIVSGLHWHGNMQIIPISDNRAKGNRYWPGMP